MLYKCYLKYRNGTNRTQFFNYMVEENPIKKMQKIIIKK